MVLLHGIFARACKVWSLPVNPVAAVERHPSVQEWMGHADIQTTMRYLHYAPREEDA